MKRFSSGITSIELSILVLVLAILFGTAVPYYLHLQAQVRSTMMVWTSSALRMAVVLVRTQAKLVGAKDGETITVERRLGEKEKVSINQMLNPTATRRGILRAVEIPDSFGQIEISFDGGVGYRMLTYSIRDTDECKVIYREDLMSGLITVRKDTSDCY